VGRFQPNFRWPLAAKLLMGPKKNLRDETVASRRLNYFPSLPSFPPLPITFLTFHSLHPFLFQSQTLPADDICALPFDITWQYHVTGSVLLVVGPSLSQVRRSGIHYRIVSVVRRSAVIVSDNCWRRTYFCVTTEYTQRSRDASWLCAI